MSHKPLTDSGKKGYIFHSPPKGGGLLRLSRAFSATLTGRFGMGVPVLEPSVAGVSERYHNHKSHVHLFIFVGVKFWCRIMNDGKLIDLIQSYPHLYDKKRSDFKDAKKKEILG
jgi:hypothetical protein